MAGIDFWYEFASTYSYLSVMRIEEAAKQRGVEIRWRPFLLGPIFAAQGWDNSPFNIYPPKGRYMFRDMERLCAAQGIAFKRPDPFPQNSILAARLALVGIEEGWAADFTKAVFHAEFSRGETISDEVVLRQCLERAGADNIAASLARAGEADIKLGLRTQTEKAQALDIFGAPTFICRDGELFWGDDRLERALDHATGKQK